MELYYLLLTLFLLILGASWGQLAYNLFMPSDLCCKLNKSATSKDKTESKLLLLGEYSVYFIYCLLLPAILYAALYGLNQS